MTGNIEDLQEIWGTLDVCYVRPEKYNTEELLPIVNFRRYKAFENRTISEINSLLRAIIGAKSVSLLRMLINDQSHVIIMGRVLAATSSSQPH
jgi:hypothetical protein